MRFNSPTPLSITGPVTVTGTVTAKLTPTHNTITFPTGKKVVLTGAVKLTPTHNTVKLPTGTTVSLSGPVKLTPTHNTVSFPTGKVVGITPAKNTVGVSNKPTTTLLHGQAATVLRSGSVASSAIWTLTSPSPLPFKALCIGVSATGGSVPYCAQATTITNNTTRPKGRSAPRFVVPFARTPGTPGSWMCIVPLLAVNKTAGISPFSTRIGVQVYWSAATAGTYTLLGLTEAPNMLWRPDGRSYPIGRFVTALSLPATGTNTVLPALATFRYLLSMIALTLKAVSATTGVGATITTTSRLIVPTRGTPGLAYPPLPAAGLLTSKNSAVTFKGSINTRISLTYDVVV